MTIQRITVAIFLLATAYAAHAHDYSELFGKWKGNAYEEDCLEQSEKCRMEVEFSKSTISIWVKDKFNTSNQIIKNAPVHYEDLNPNRKGTGWKLHIEKNDATKSMFTVLFMSSDREESPITFTDDVGNAFLLLRPSQHLSSSKKP